MKFTISIFKNNEKNFFDYKKVCQFKGHVEKIYRIIQLSNNLIASGSADRSLIIWEKTKKNDLIDLQRISNIKLEILPYNLIECPYTNELICNSQTVDLKTYKVKRKLNISFPGSDFNCSICLFKEKYLAYADILCEGEILDIETNKHIPVQTKFDYVEAAFTIDGETFCFCIQNPTNIFRSRYSQHFIITENKCKNLGKIICIGGCNCYMNDSEGNFIMGDMGGHINKFK